MSAKNIVPDQKYYITVNDSQVANDLSLKPNIEYAGYFDKVIDDYHTFHIDR